MGDFGVTCLTAAVSITIIKTQKTLGKSLRQSTDALLEFVCVGVVLCVHVCGKYNNI